MLLLYGLKGNAAAVGAGTLPEGSYLFKPGIRVEYLKGAYKHQFDLAFTARGGKTGMLDNGAGLSNPHGAGAGRSDGTGLANLRERLRLLYGDGASVEVRDTSLGCEAMLTLPWEPVEGQPGQ